MKDKSKMLGESARTDNLASACGLQRVCSCGNHTVAGGQCDACKTGPAPGVPPVVNQVLSSPGQPLDTNTRAFFEPRFGRDFSRVRVHTDPEAAESATALEARAFTSSQHVVFSERNYQPETPDGQRLLAHELAHVVQQEGSAAQNAHLSGPSISRPGDASEVAADRAADLAMSNAGQHAGMVAKSAHTHPAIQRAVDDPKRFQQTNESLFVAAPASAGGKLLTWEDPDPAAKKVGTAEVIFNQAKANIKQHLKNNPGAASGTVPTQTTEADLDQDAVDVAQQLRARFPFMSVSATSTQIESAVSVMTPSLTSSTGYLREWMANKLSGWSDVEKYDIKETDPRLIALLDKLLADADVGPSLKVMATRPSGFQRGQGTTREIFIHRGTAPDMRKKVLFHELTHFHAHPIFREWVATTTNERYYNEGFTEYLARLAMPAATLKLSNSYQDRVDSIKNEVAVNVPDDDIARAYFRGEIWRIETRSKISRREVGAQLGLSEAATEKEEQEASRTGPGINQTVVPGQHFRFMNLGFDQSKPKPEHITFFKDIKTQTLDPAPTQGVIFEGHASTAGTPAYNMDLSLGRARAFYKMSRDEGVPSDRLIDSANPPHFGETKLTAEEEDPATRAFNRRVEMHVKPVSTKADKKTTK
jgi:outer membrane protein OmpA-like peptidoglycan-associated protein